MPDALLDIVLKLVDCGAKDCRKDARGCYTQGLQDDVKTLFEVFYIIAQIFESVHKTRIYVRRGLLSLAETKWLREDEGETWSNLR